MEIQKALSIKQPWAHLIAAGIKDIENRTWKTHFRGKIYIHACSPMKFDVKLTDEQMIKAFPAIGDAIDGKLTFGAIIGEVEISDCVINHSSIWAEKSCEAIIYNWVLINPVTYDKPVLNVKGRLSFWEPLICLQKCESCSEPTNIETMTCDDNSNWFCPECWEELWPIMLQEAKENRD